MSARAGREGTNGAPSGDPSREAALAHFPYAPRPHQAEILRFLGASLAAGRHAVLESGTGTGKTVCALAAALPHARASGRRILYLTRTHSQARQVMTEYRRIQTHLEDPSSRRIPGRRTALALQGRAHLCPLRSMDAELEGADPEELGVMCRDRMRAAERVHEGLRSRGPVCPFHLRGLQDGSDELVAWARAESPEAERLAERVVAAGQCPFVLSRRLLAEAELVVAPYVYFLHPHLRASLLRSMGAALGDLVVLVDEAHNLPQHARDLATARLGRRTLALAQSEARHFGDPTVLRDVPLSAFLATLGEILGDLRESFVPEGAEDALLPPDELTTHLLSGLQTSTPALDRAIALLDEYGASVREAKRRAGKRPRSEVGTVARFLVALRSIEHDDRAPIIEVEGDEPRLVLLALDAALLAGALEGASATIHLSGTLRPLDEHGAALGLGAGRTDARSFPSPFAAERRLVLVDDTVTTRHEDVVSDPSLWDEMGQRLRDLRSATDRNVAVFLPSHEVLHRLAPHVRGERTFVETRKQADLMAQVDAFRASRGGTLLSVMGGRLSEGLDFPDEELEVVVVVGLPYAKPSAKLEALIRFYDRRWGRGWEWAVKAPMVRRVLQAAGRLIRTPTDRGVVVLLDRRAAMLREALPELVVSSDTAAAVAGFFAREAS